LKLEDILEKSSVLADLCARTKRDVLLELIRPLADQNLIPNRDEALRVILDRENLGSTGIGDGVAIPHGKLKTIDSILCVFGRSKAGIDFESVDEKPVHIFFLLLAPEGSASLHLKVLSRISKILRDSSFRKKLLTLPDEYAIYETVIAEDRKIL